MKKFFLLILSLMTLAWGAAAQPKSVNVDVTGKKLETVLNEISEQSGVVFSYELKLSDVKITVSGKKSGSLSSVLDWVLSGTGVKWKEITSERIALSKDTDFEKVQSKSAKKIRVSGKVTDATGLPQPGTVVYQKNDMTNGTMTDADGAYTIMVPEGKTILVYSLLGYKDSEVRVDGRTVINVTLEDDTTLLSEVLVVGYGTQKKEFMVGSVSQVSSKDLLKAPNTNVSTMLAGRLAGVTSVQTTGIPGGDQANILVRGLSTFNNASPLVIVDGVERSMNSLNPNDIASVTVLKDAATAAIYGVKAANGVILVTTKTGTEGSINIIYDGSVSFDTNTVTPDLLNAEEYIYWHNKAREMDGQAPYWTEERIASLKERGLYGETDNWHLLYKDFGLTQQHTVTATGGTDKMHYYTSIGYLGQDGIMRNTSYERFNVRANITANLAKGLKYNINMSAANANRNWPGLSMRDSSSGWQGEFSPLRQACYAIPILKSSYEGLPLGFTNGTYTYTPEAANNTGFQQTDQWMAEIRSTLEYDFSESGIGFLKGLKAGINFAYNLDYTLNRNYLESFELYSYDANTDLVTKKVSLGIAENNFNKSHSVGYNATIRPQLTYDRDFGKSHVSGILLAERYTYHGDTMTGLKSGYTDGSPIDISMGMKDSSSPVSGSYSNAGSFSIAGRLGYAYDKKYLAEFTFREDASYKFSPENRWGFFPSVALGWVISNEDWMQDIYWLDHLKLRTSAGVLGSDDVTPYLFMQSYKSTAPTYTYIIDGTPNYTFYTSGYVMDGLTWSKTKSANIGIESKLFRSRLSVDLDFFYKYTTNILEYAPTGTYSPSLGGNNPSWKNSGIVDNRGFDMTASWGDVVGDWTYTITGIVSYAHNRVLSAEITDDHPSYRSVIGQPMGSIYGFHATGLFQSQEQVDAYPTAPSGSAILGAIMYEDVNGDGKISSTEDFVKIGRSSTPEMTFSLNFDLSWKNFSLSALFQGATLCNYCLNGTWNNGNMDSTMYTRTFYGGGNTMRYLVEGAWTDENTDAKYPRLTASYNANDAWTSSWWVRDGSYVRLKNMQFAYELPKKVLNATPLSGLRLFLAGTNLFTISAFKYIDPENPGINNGYYPQQRTVSLGVKATF